MVGGKVGYRVGKCYCEIQTVLFFDVMDTIFHCDLVLILG